jgi:hypothetical protein
MERLRKWTLRALVIIQGVSLIGLVTFILDAPARWEALSSYELWVRAHWPLVAVFLLGAFTAYIIIRDVAIWKTIRQVESLKELGSKITQHDLALNELKESTKTLNAVAMLTYLQRNRPELEKAIGEYTAGWEQINNFANSKDTKWESGPDRMSTSISRVSNRMNMWTGKIETMANDVFDFPFDRAPEYKEIAAELPDPQHIPVEGERKLYRKAWVANERMKFKLKLLQDDLDKRRDEAMIRLADHAKRQLRAARV